jgi:hypothetical protein
MNDRPIDKVRNAGLSMILPADTGGITHMGEINGALHIIGGSAIYRVQLADDIDSKRTNIAIPNTHQKVPPYGTEFPYVRQTLMTARRLFRDNVLGPAFGYKTGINLSFEALQDLAAMHDIRRDVGARFDKIAEDLENLSVDRRSMTLPSMGDVRGKPKLFCKKPITSRSPCSTSPNFSMAMKLASAGLHRCTSWQARNTATMMSSPIF